MRIRTPSPALVVSLVALFVALGGTSYAALRIPRNSVGAAQIQNNAVIDSKVRKGTLTGDRLKNGTVTAGKINTKGLTAPNAIHATIAVSAQTAATATTASSATTATSAGTATVASSPGPLASGKSETGVYDIQYVAGHAGDEGSAALSFPFPLATPVTQVEWIPAGGTADSNCSGSAAAPTAAAGYLCLYASTDENVTTRCVAGSAGSCTTPAFAYGAVPELTALAAGPTASVGTWAVTAP